MSTDIDILVSLGYSQELSRRALAATKGDRKAALDLIKNNRKTREDGWKTDEETDWVRLGINNSSSLPKDATMRGVSLLLLSLLKPFLIVVVFVSLSALWKTPISVHIGSYRLGSATSEHEVRYFSLSMSTLWTISLFSDWLIA